jgi:hypothetical protein
VVAPITAARLVDVHAEWYKVRAMPWVLVAFAVVWVLILVLVFALCLSVRRIDRAIGGTDDVTAATRSAGGEPDGELDDITARHTSLS